MKKAKNTNGTYWGYCLNRLDVLKRDARPAWQWTGIPSHKPQGRINDWLNMFLKAGDYFPSVDEITKYSPDAGTELERFDSAIHIAYTTAFAQKFGIGVQGVLFTLTTDDTVSLKTETI